MASTLNYIDLFAGAGGLSEGFARKGFNPVAHVEMNADACKTIETRVAYQYLKANGQAEKYYDYLKGKISREDFLSHVPNEIKDSVINSEISSKSIKGIFSNIPKNIDFLVFIPLTYNSSCPLF